MTEPAILLTDAFSEQSGKVAKLLRFFGVESRIATADELLSNLSGLNGSAGPTNGLPIRHSERYRILCSSDHLEKLIGKIAESPSTLQWWKERVHSAFVYAGGDFKKFEHLARRLIQNVTVFQKLPCTPTDFSVTDQLKEFCGIMARISGTMSARCSADCYAVRTSSAQLVDIISGQEGAIFIKLKYYDVPVFLSTGKDVVELDAVLPNGIFDIRDHVTSALPPVLYIKWAFPTTCWNGAETNACLVIDDPVLKANYGFVNFQELLMRMRHHRFSTSVAFIPWNSSRSELEVIKLFKENPSYYSISVHGCDHGKAEFGSGDEGVLYSKARQALERMNNHESATGLGYDRVMVFPQGVFSKAAVTALNQAGFIAAVNNDTIDVGPDPVKIRIRDFWETAIMAYGRFPIFTRRYPWEGIENFAFDAILGKPAIAVIHHNDCGDGYGRLCNFIDQLNRLDCSVTWRTLADVVRRSFRQKTVADDSIEIEMYATELLLQNNTPRPLHYSVHRRRTKSSQIEEIRTDGERIEWREDTDGLFFGVDLQSGQSTTISIRFRDFGAEIPYKESLLYKANILARRHLCEVRDNYFVPSKRYVTDRLGLTDQGAKSTSRQQRSR